MAITKKIFVCTKCDAQTSKWQGRCDECGAWGTLQENLNSNTTGGAVQKPALIISGANIKQNKLPERLSTGLEEIDRVFGGGLVPGSLILIGGEPGIGKSTVVAQIAETLASKNKTVYLSGEESAAQIGLRLERIGCTLANFNFITETEINSAINALIAEPPALLIIDSIQTVYVAGQTGEAGSVSQIRAATVKLLEFAKSKNTIVIIIGHITKDGQMAGPKTLEHLVDTVIYLETDSSQNYRLLRSSKNRFGSTNELGVFEMTGAGLKPVDNPSGLFLDIERGQNAGISISAVAEGSRQFLIEVQALTAKTVFGYPQRRTSGFDANRLQVLATVIGKRANINLSAHDIILNIVGGLKITDPGLDLAVCLSIISSFFDKEINKQTVIIGEVGLAGEIRPVPRLEAKLREAAKLGFTQAIVPKNNLKIDGLNIISVKDLKEAVNIIRSQNT